MPAQESLADFSSEIYEQLAAMVGQTRQLPSMAFFGEIDPATGKARLVAMEPLSFHAQKGEPPSATAERLIAEGRPLVALAHESWMTFLPGMPAKMAQTLFKTSAPRPGKRTEAVCVDIRTEASQSLAIHGIRKKAGVRVLEQGEILPSSITFGGRMAREQGPTLN